MPFQIYFHSLRHTHTGAKNYYYSINVADFFTDNWKISILAKKARISSPGDPCIGEVIIL